MIVSVKFPASSSAWKFVILSVNCSVKSWSNVDAYGANVSTVVIDLKSELNGVTIPPYKSFLILLNDNFVGLPSLSISNLKSEIVEVTEASHGNKSYSLKNVLNWVVI